MSNKELKVDTQYFIELMSLDTNDFEKIRCNNQDHQYSLYIELCKLFENEDVPVTKTIAESGIEYYRCYTALRFPAL